MKLKIGRREYYITNKDIIYYNGYCYQLITQEYYNDFGYCHSVMSKSQFNKLFKEGKLVLMSERYEGKNGSGSDIYSRKYRFNVNEE